MFRALTCPSSGGPIVFSPVKSSALNRFTVQPFTESDDTGCCKNTICPPEDGHKSALNRFIVHPFTESDDTRCCENTICPPEDGHVNARNMSRIVV